VDSRANADAAKADLEHPETAFGRLMIGTVQFGLPYGVANRTGQPSYAEARQMIAMAIDAGVRSFDTAAAYGTSEEVLGRALRELDAAQRVRVVTKVTPLDPETRRDRKRAEATIRDSVLRSQRLLGEGPLSLVLFHRVEDAFLGDVLQSLCDAGVMLGWGVSCDHDPLTAMRLLDDPRVAALQIPGNLLDRRHLAGGTRQTIVGRAESTSPNSAIATALFVRSVYLQGLLLMPEREIPTHLRDVIPPRRQLAALADQAGITLAELALRYPLSLPGVTSVVVGAETPDQLHENLRLIARGPLDGSLVTQIEAVPVDLPDRVLTPARWSEVAAAVASPKGTTT
jgi:aryl-alcohol dehydrogenase-like predicted oxidoreductase